MTVFGGVDGRGMMGQVGCFVKILRIITLLGPIMSAVLLSAQQVSLVDATGHLRLRSKEPTAVARGGPLQPLYTDESQPLWPELISITPVEPKGARQAVFEMKVTNKSKGALVIPIDPHSADFDGLLASTGTSNLSLVGISIALADKAANSCVLDGDLKLLGNRSVPKSLLTLRPGEWVRIKAPLHMSCSTVGAGAEPEFTGGLIHAVVSFGTEQIVSQGDVLRGSEIIQNFVNSQSIGVDDGGYK